MPEPPADISFTRSGTDTYLMAGRSTRWDWLGHRRWQGIGGLVAIVALILGIVLPLTLGRGSTQVSRSAAVTTHVTSTVISVATTTLSSAPQANRQRDPNIGTASIETEASGEFFEGRFLVSIGEIDYGNNGTGDLLISRVVVGAGSGRCLFRKVPNGESLAIAASGRLYWADIRGLSLSGAEVVAFREPAPSTFVSGDCQHIKANSLGS
jgi:hypothetical protein